MTKKLPDAEARAVMLDAGFDPSIPYPGNKMPWPGVCLKCGQPGSPTYSNTVKGWTPCGYCAGKKIDSAILVGRMLAKDFSPSVPFTSVISPWMGVCLKCGQPGDPTYNNSQRWGACRYCAGRKIDSAVAHGKMMAAGVTPQSTFLGVMHFLDVQCDSCGQKWRTKYNYVQQGNSPCRECSDGGGFRSSKPAVVYVVASDRWLKLGISNVTEKRLRNHRAQGLDRVLHVIEFPNGHDALAMEKLWLERIANFPAHVRATKADVPDGHTETVRNLPSILHWIESTLLPLAA